MILLNTCFVLPTHHLSGFIITLPICPLYMHLISWRCATLLVLSCLCLSSGISSSPVLLICLFKSHFNIAFPHQALPDLSLGLYPWKLYYFISFVSIVFIEARSTLGYRCLPVSVCCTIHLRTQAYLWQGLFLHFCIPGTWHRVWSLESTQIVLNWIHILWFFVVRFFLMGHFALGF